MKTFRNILILVLVIGLSAGFAAFSLLSRRVAPNPPGAVGNTAGNLNNGGLFCEDENKVYFSNPYDDNTLYCMNPDETEVQKLSDARVSSLNAAGKYLYYYQSSSAASDSFSALFRINGLYRSKKDGKSAVCLKRTPAAILAVADNTIFYQHYDNREGGSFRRIDIDKKNEMLLDDVFINPSSIQDGKIYYGGMKEDHHLYSLDIHSNNISTLYAGNVYNPVIKGDYVYYMDISSKYKLCRYCLSSGQTELLSGDRLDFFNVTDSYIYYQKSDAARPALKRVLLDGAGEEVVAEGVYEHINATSRYVYFNAYDAPTPMFHTPVDGPVMVGTFSPIPEEAR